MAEYFRNNESVKAAGVKVEFTAHQVQEMTMCALDPVYFTESYVHVEHVDHGIIPYEPRPYQKKMFDAIHNNRYSVIMIGRQSGKTLVAACYILWYAIFKPEKLVAILANKAEMAAEILHKIQVMYEMLPDWMKPGVVVYNKRSMEFANGSRIFCSATSASAIRGRAVSLLYVDELAFIPKNLADPFMASIYPTVSSGTTTKIIFSSTPYGLNHFWTLWNDAEKGKSKFTPLFIHYSEVPGRTEEWAEEQKKLIGEVRFQQEYGCEFFGSSPTLISAGTMKQMEAKPYITVKPDIRMYEEPQEGHAYAIVVDTSRGVMLDYSVFTVVDVTKLPYKQVAVYSSNEVSPMLFPTIIRAAAKRYNEAMVLVEINDNGQQVANILFDELEYENVLFTKAAGRRGVDISNGGSGSTCGIRTTKTVKAIGCSTLRSMVEQGKLEIIDQATIEELWHFNEQANGTFQAESGYHDDHVMTLVLFAWLASKPYFMHLFDTDLRRGIFGDRIKEIESTLLPDPIINTGHSPDVPRVIEGEEALWLIR
jgi:hypothetical protein